MNVIDPFECWVGVGPLVVKCSLLVLKLLHSVVIHTVIHNEHPLKT